MSSVRVNINSVLCVKCGRCIHSRCAEMLNVGQQFSRDFAKQILVW